MSVNPSGGDHNWNISVLGNNGLALDLVRGVNNRPTKWGSAIALTAGIDYAFKFRVMHSNIASYGSGGVGGVDIHYTPPVDGSYDFIFDDRDDSYLVQLTGTEGPPTYLSAQSGLDGHIRVGWLPPGTTESSELSYDDGTLVNGYYYFAYDNQMGEMFTPANYPVTIDSVMVHVLTEGDQWWPWPDGSHDPVGVSIFLDDGSGYPAIDPAFYTEVTCTPGEWIRVDVEEILVASGNFWVTMNNLEGGGDDGIGLDATTDYPGNKWARIDGVWGTQDIYQGDHMVRAKVFGATSLSWMGYDASPAGEVRTDIRHHNDISLVSGTKQANEILPASKSGSLNRMAFHPNSSRVHPPIGSDTEVLAGYNLYRDLAAAPYDRRPGTKINIVLIQGTTYDDWGPGGLGLPNGVLQHYQASAVYDIGGGQFVEVGPSNEATGTPVNHEPANPVNLTGQSLGNNVSLVWNRNTDYDIAQYRIYRRDYGQQNYTLVGTNTHPDTTFGDIINVDGIYRYKIAAVDAGGMQSVGFSNPIDIPIGAIPPRNLRASTDEEFQVSLRWNHPGSGGGDLNVLVIAADDANTFMGEIQAFEDVTVADFFDGRNGTPTLADLSAYNVVVCWSNFVFQDANGMGNVLADYLESGGGVVLGQFCFGTGWGLEGRIMTEYAPFSQGPTQYMNKNLGEFDPTHAIMEGITSLTEFYQASVSVINEGVLVASFDDGTPFVATHPTSPLVCVNGFLGDDRQFTGDMVAVFHNALGFVSSSGEVQPQNYKVHKSANRSGPYNVLVTLPGADNRYVDEPVPNGVNYYYYVTAVYPGPDESDPTDTTMGVAQNHPPLSPFNLDGQATGMNVTVHWSFENAESDWASFNVYKRLMPSGTTTLVGNTTDSTYTFAIPNGQDGVYKITVTAVDNGVPPLESAPSREKYLPVGHLPPTNLRASSNWDEAVPLRWSLPGSWMAAGAGVIESRDRDNTVRREPAPLDLSQKGRPEVINPPVVLSRGGPDAFGYEWVDSDEPDGPTYEWRDITGDGTQIPITMDDENQGPFDIGFDFPYYGQTYSQFYVCSNGWISFTSTSAQYTNGELPNIDAPENMLAPFWDDLYAPDGGAYWYRSDGNELVVSFIDIPHIGGGGPYTFQIVLRSAGTMLYEYSTLGAPLNDCTVGLQNGDGSIGMTMTYNADYLHDSMAIRIADHPEGFSPAHFNLYRATAPNVPVDPAHRIASIPGTELAYIDTTNVNNGTTYYYVMTATWADSIASPASNEASGTPVLGARMTLNPLSFDLTGSMGSITTANLNIANPGGLPLSFVIDPTSSSAILSAKTPAKAVRPAQPETPVVLTKDQVPESNNPPMLLGRGGPDEFGYIWIDSDEPDGPANSWVEITDRGNQVFLFDDQNVGPFDLQFSFPFYDGVFTSFYICSNGWASFTSTGTTYSNGLLPDPFAPQNMLAIFWDDLNPSMGGEIWYYTSADSAIISWINVPHYSEGGPYTFQIVLTSGGGVFYNYQDVGFPDNSCTIGIQDGSGTVGLQVAYDQAYVHNALTIRFSAGWLSTNPGSGVVNAGGNTNISVICDATTLTVGTYTGSLTVSGWDDNHQLVDVVIPVTFHVTQTGIEGDADNVPKEFSLSQNYPNPFNPTTEIEFALPTNSHVTLSIFNVLGQKVKSLVNADLDAGYKSVIWDGSDDSGVNVASGTYFYVLKAGDKSFTKKMTMLK